MAEDRWGDKGGKTFKMVFQIVNTRAPNSPNNTVIFSIFEAPDSMTNLKVVRDRFGEEIKELEHHIWKLVMVTHSNREDIIFSIIYSGKKIKVFICGYYEFLTAYQELVVCHSIVNTIL